MADSDIALEGPEQKGQTQMTAKILRLCAIGVACLLFFHFLNVKFQIAGYGRQLELIKKQRVVLDEIKETQGNIASIRAIISDVEEKAAPVDLILKKLSTITPDNIVFREMRLNQNRKSLKLKGRILAEKDKAHGMLSDFIDALEGVWFFKEATLADMSKGSSEGDKTSVFEINCILNIQ